MRNKYFILFIIIALSGIASTGHCMDEVRMLPGSSDGDTRQAYPTAVLIKALEATDTTDGPFRITLSRLRMTRVRALEEMASGRHINVYVAMTQPEWENKTIPIRIPILKGLLGYRLLLIDCRNRNRLKDINTLKALAKLKGGAGAQWSITKVYLNHQMRLITGNNYDGLFSMLNAGRFDYFARGINEIFAELEHKRQEFPNMCVEPHLALHSPAPSYFFVSPAWPKLADRIRRGMEKIRDNGILDALFHEYYDKSILRAKLHQRTILEMSNPYLPKSTPLDDPELWFKP